MYLYPIEDFVNAQSQFVNEAKREGRALRTCPLFNSAIGDGHFSAAGAEVWAEAVGRRLILLLEQRQVHDDWLARLDCGLLRRGSDTVREPATFSYTCWHRPFVNRSDSIRRSGVSVCLRERISHDSPDNPRLPFDRLSHLPARHRPVSIPVAAPDGELRPVPVDDPGLEHRRMAVRDQLRGQHRRVRADGVAAAVHSQAADEALACARFQLVLSLFIEGGQLVSGRRVPDVDDLILNVLGGCLGYLLSRRAKS